MHFNLKKFAKVVSQVAPIAMAAAGVPPEVVGKVQHLIVLAESKPQTLSGAGKKAFVLDGLRTGGSIADDLIHPGVTDLDLDQLTAAVSSGIDGTIAMVKAVENIPVRP